MRPRGKTRAKKLPPCQYRERHLEERRNAYKGEVERTLITKGESHRMIDCKDRLVSQKDCRDADRIESL
jgi:hypothetical protein